MISHLFAIALLIRSNHISAYHLHWGGVVLIEGNEMEGNDNPGCFNVFSYQIAFLPKRLQKSLSVRCLSALRMRAGIRGKATTLDNYRRENNFLYRVSNATPLTFNERKKKLFSPFSD